MDDPFDQINTAIAEADRLAEDFELWKAKRAQRVTKDYNADLVYKTRDDALVQPQQQAATMDEATSKGWNDWFAKSFRLHANEFGAAFASVIGEANAEVLYERLEPIRKQLKELRAELDTLKRSKASKARSRK